MGSYRKFKGYDVPGSLMKSAPNFCSVYVISKGKILSARTALRPMANTATPPKQPSSGGLPPTPEQNGEETRYVPKMLDISPSIHVDICDRSSLSSTPKKMYLNFI